MTSPMKSSPMKRRKVGQQHPPWWVMGAFLAPALLLYTVFLIYPLVQSLLFSFYSWTSTVRGDFIGFDNFRELFSRSPLNEQLPRDIWHNLVFFIGTMLLQVSLGLLFAVLLQRKRFGKSFLRTIYVLPYMVSPLVVGYVWALILNPNFGPLNSFLKSVGLDALAQPWLGDPDLAFPVVILVNVWFWVGFPMLLFAAGLAAIPEDYAEAARIDGANSWQLFRRITFPLLTPVFGTVTILTFVNSFNVFGLIFALAGVEGGPVGSTDVLGLLFYRTAFRGGVDAYGVASALAVIMFLMIFGASMLARWWFGRLEEGIR